MKRSLLTAFLVGTLGFVGAGCGGGDNSTDGGAKTSNDVTADQVSGDVHGYVANSLVLPTGAKDKAIDLNGDGVVDNQLGNVIGTLAGAGLDTQGSVDKSVASGGVVLLVNVQTTDLAKSDAVGATVYIGQKLEETCTGDADAGTEDCTGGPDFSGMGSFAVDSSQAPAAFYGKLAGNKFASNSPITTTHPVTITLKIPLVEGGDPLPLIINGARLSFTTGTDDASGKAGLLDGQINGSVKNSDIQQQVIPAVVSLLNNMIDKDPEGSTAKQVLSIFDTGNCTNADNSMATAGDGKIDVCEVSTNSLIGNVLSPDVKIYNDKGDYAPYNKKCKAQPKDATDVQCDSMSLGVGFTAVAATITGAN